MLVFNAREKLLMQKAGRVGSGNDLMTYYLILTEMKNNNNENCRNEFFVIILKKFNITRSCF